MTDDYYMSPEELRRSVLYGNKIAAAIDQRNNVKPGFRFDAALRHSIARNGRGEAINLAIRFASHNAPPYQEWAMWAKAAQAHVHKLATTRAVDINYNNYGDNLRS